VVESIQTIDCSHVFLAGEVLVALVKTQLDVKHLLSGLHSIVPDMQPKTLNNRYCQSFVHVVTKSINRSLTDDK